MYETTERLAAPTSSLRLPPELREAVEAALERAVRERWSDRVWDRDTSLWSTDPGVAALIADRLGWLDAPSLFRERVDVLEAFAAGIRAEGLTAALVCGMGGSSLAPEVLARSLGEAGNGIAVDVLDSTHPAAVLAAERAYDASSRLYLVATKSGTTTETLSFLAHFWHVEEKLHGGIPEQRAGDHFVAITDPGKSLDEIPRAEGFREVFLNPPDVGGRYSALTYVGLVPGALLGLDLRALLDGALGMAGRCRADRDNPGLMLGVAMGALARAGRDKLTLLIEPQIASFGAWAEQLIAESTGKHGVGIVPIDAEPEVDASAYGPDRVFVRLGGATASPWRAETDRRLDSLAAAGHPVIDLVSEHEEGLGGEFFRWEFATSIAGAVLGINPFDEPNVTESKDNTRRVLAGYRESGSLPREDALVEQLPLRVYGDAPLRLTMHPSSVEDALLNHLRRARTGGYVSFQAYLAPSPERDGVLAELRRLVLSATGRATTAGYGPRFLHSTGQLHKGGAPSGCFIQLLGGQQQDVPIPGAHESFGTLIEAQALGDFASLQSHDLPVLRIDLSDDVDAGLEALVLALRRALERGL